MAENDRHEALARMTQSLARGAHETFSAALADAMRAGVTRDEIEAYMQAASASRPSRPPFDPFELSEVFTALPCDP